MIFVTYVMAIGVVVSSLAFVGYALEALTWRRMTRRWIPMYQRDEHLDQFEFIKANQTRAQAWGGLCLALIMVTTTILLAAIASVRFMTSELLGIALIAAVGFVSAGIGYVVVKYYDARFCDSYLKSTYF